MAALRALAQIAVRGDMASTKLVDSFATHHKPKFRVEAMNALSLIAPRGHRSSLERCSKLLLEDWHKETQHAALGALQNLTKDGDQLVIAALCLCVEDQPKDLGFPALHLLSRLAPAHHETSQRLLQEMSREWGVSLSENTEAS